jgi:hypothetical protein
MNLQEAAQENAVIQEMIAQAQAAAEPGDRPGTVVEKGDAPMVVRSVDSAGYVNLWDTRTGEHSLTNANMLPTQLKKKRPDGSRVFTTVNPGITPPRGTIKCLLHPEGENRAHYDSLGFGVCRKSNLVSLFQLEQHMKHKHKQEYATIEKERADQQRAEDREFQRNLMQAASGHPPERKAAKT